MKILRLSIAATIVLTMTAVEASPPYRFGHNGRRVSAHAPTPAKVTHGSTASSKSGPTVQARPQPHVETLPATVLTRSAAAPMTSSGMTYSEPKLSTAQENELRWRLYSYP
ncbi:hypothetical protein [Iodobacter sp.]|uniref:hypothetical protein n=1 Tax=Iodobacter sp. TaxID=1915058 RepID=UPI0025EA28CB|nr:hypothetical protein [Iodobacter sp.]